MFLILAIHYINYIIQQYQYGSFSICKQLTIINLNSNFFYYTFAMYINSVFAFFVLLVIQSLSQPCSTNLYNDQIYSGTKSFIIPTSLPNRVNIYAMPTSILSQFIVYENQQLQIVQSVKNIKNFQTYNGMDFSLKSIISSGNIKIILIVNNATWLSINVQFLISQPRSQFFLTSFLADTPGLLFNGKSSVSITKNINWILNQNTTSITKVIVFINGLRTTTNNFELNISNTTYNSTTGSISLDLSQSVNGQIQIVYFSCIVLDVDKVSYTYRYSFTNLNYYFSISGISALSQAWPYNSESLLSIQRINNLSLYQNQYIGCISIQNCAAVAGQIINQTCLICAQNQQYLNGVCIPACNTNQIYNSSLSFCACKPGFYRINNICSQCASGTFYNIGTLSCQNNCAQNLIFSNVSGLCEVLCPVGSFYNITFNKCTNYCTQPNQIWSGKCICANGFVRIANFCSTCSVGTVYNIQTLSCDLTCSATQIYNASTLSCTCKLGYVNISGQCGSCPSNLIYNTTEKKCQTKCPQNSNLLNGACTCYNGYYNISGICQICPTGTIFNSINNSCVLSCVGLFQYYNGKCVCKKGYVLIGEICGTCLAGQNYNSVTLSCESMCLQSEAYINGNCVCLPPLIKYNSSCIACPINTIYDYNTSTCRQICQPNQIYSQSLQKCQCTNNLVSINGVCGTCPNGTSYDTINKNCSSSCSLVHEIYYSGLCLCDVGYLRIGNQCSQCPSGTNYNSTSFSCYTLCNLPNQVFNQSTSNCQCITNYHLINNSCQTCLSGQTYNSSTNSCQSQNQVTCQSNQILTSGVCQCMFGMVKINGQCGLCPFGTTYNYSSQVCQNICNVTTSYYQNGVCKCLTTSGYYLIGNTCQQCPPNSTYNATSLACSVINPTCSGAYQIYSNGSCVCQSGYLKINGVCGQCASGTIYNLSSQSCQNICNATTSSFINGGCVCLQTYYLINNVCQQCPPGTIYNSSSLQCQLQCSTNQILVNGICQCDSGYYLIANQCTTCSNGQYYNTTTQNCQSICNSTTSYYSNGNCLCLANYYLINNICQQCPQNTFYNDTTRTCHNTNIVACNSSTEILASNGSCICNTANGYFFVYDQCAQCPLFTKYNALTLSCELSILGVQTTNPLGVSTSVNTNSTNIIANTSSNVASVTNSSAICLIQFMQSINGTCQCATGMIQYNGLCFFCGVNSHSNKNKTLCICDSGFYLVGQICVKNQQCPLNAYWNQTSCICSSGYYMISNRCFQIPTCPPNSLFIQSQLKCVCNNNYHLNANQTFCQSCNVNQTWNQKANSCTCITQYYKINGICQTCSSNSVFNGSVCICNNGYYSSNSLGSILSCSACHYTCFSCTGPFNNQCLSCKNLSDTLTSSTCIASSNICGSGYYLNQTCLKCSSYCSTCNSLLNCSACTPGFYMQNYTSSGILIMICSQVCGDGLRFVLQCDDGNTISGDGCSSNCSVQTDWVCSGGNPTSKDLCSQPTVKNSIIQIKQCVISISSVFQNINLSYFPSVLTSNNCQYCNDLLNITVYNATIIPNIVINYISDSKYQFVIEFGFGNIYTIPPFKFSVQINSAYGNYFTNWDLNQYYQVSIDPSTLSKVDNVSYLSGNNVTA